MRKRFLFAALTTLVVSLTVAQGAAAGNTGAVSAVPGGVPTTAAPGDEVSTTAATTAGNVHLRFKVQRFIVRNGRLLARTRVTATYLGNDGQTAATSKMVTMRVVRPGGRVVSQQVCRILFLRLEALTLNLLGLKLELEQPLVLRITANPRGGILGRLLCALAGNMRTQALARTATQLNRSFANTRASAFQFRFPLRPMQQQEYQECPVLELILGPLDLRLLGLRVQLSRVHLTITGIPSTQPGGGLLGDILCALAGGPLPTPPLPTPLPAP
jgi:hypothetical protein